MTLDEFLKHADARLPLDTPDIYRFMDEMSDEARHITCEINNAYHSQAELRELFSRLTGRPVDETFKAFPPFYTDFGKNITIGKHVLPFPRPRRCHVGRRLPDRARRGVCHAQP